MPDNSKTQFFIWYLRAWQVEVNIQCKIKFKTYNQQTHKDPSCISLPKCLRIHIWRICDVKFGKNKGKREKNGTWTNAARWNQNRQQFWGICRTWPCWRGLGGRGSAHTRPESRRPSRWWWWKSPSFTSLPQSTEPGFALVRLGRGRKERIESGCQAQFLAWACATDSCTQHLSSYLTSDMASRYLQVFCNWILFFLEKSFVF